MAKRKNGVAGRLHEIVFLALEVYDDEGLTNAEGILAELLESIERPDFRLSVARALVRKAQRKVKRITDVAWATQDVLPEVADAVVDAVGGALVVGDLLLQPLLHPVPDVLQQLREPLDRRERETPWVFAAAFLWGGLVATTIALPANTAVIMAIAHWLEGNAALQEMLGPDAALMVGAPLSAPLVEETAKGLGIVLLFWLMRSEFDNVRDGFVYGALVGAGFNWFESALYVQQNLAQFGTATYGFQLGARYAWLGLAGHAMYSGTLGASLGLARATRSNLVRFLAPSGGYLLAVLAHAWNNSLPLFLAIAAYNAGEAPPTESVAPPDIGLLDAMISASISNLVIFLPFALLVIGIIRRSGESERAVIREELADEVGQPLVMDIELESSRTHRPAFIAVDITDTINGPLMQAIPTVQPFITHDKRFHQLRVSIELPPRIPGRYSLSIWVGSHNTETLDFIDNCAAFNIVESPTKGRSFPHTVDHGHVVPHSTVEYVTAAPETQEEAT